VRLDDDNEPAEATGGQRASMRVAIASTHSPTASGIDTFTESLVGCSAALASPLVGQREVVAP
jgi:hypothetical protein